ncbi:DNA repair protein rad51d [Cymbomonas tetramitiformis]|uniref:DNA repair protein rad51d n=1 Tax=Cymbomonas tetramitiformis TaxID=36881 RepID=A0AAE0GPR3_9CHLO|nr:DNA repair protein rad51d [Cymbomonas tetramitiformis]
MSEGDWVRNLDEQGIWTVEHFLTQERGEPTRHSTQGGIPQSTPALQALTAHVQRNCAPAAANGCQLEEQLRRTKFIRTGFQRVDEMLGGGLRGAQVTEITGASSSGKTQLCLTTAAVLGSTSEGRVFYIDSTNSFAAARVAEILTKARRSQQGGSLHQTLSKIHVYKVHDAYELQDVLEGLERFLGRQNNALIIIDSLSLCIAPLLGGSQIQGHAVMTSIGKMLHRIASETGAAILYTNHTVADRSQETMTSGHMECKPALGHTWRSQPHLRIQLFKEVNQSHQEEGKVLARVLHGGPAMEASFYPGQEVRL